MAEQAYPPHVLDLLAVVQFLLFFRHYLLGRDAQPTRGPVRFNAPDRQSALNQAVSQLRTSIDFLPAGSTTLDYEMRSFASTWGPCRAASPQPTP